MGDPWPISFWWHHPVDDRRIDGLVGATLTKQQRFGFDLVKVSPAGTYQTMDLGVVDGWCGTRRGYGAIIHYPVRSSGDWEGIIARSAVQGPALERATAALALIRSTVDRAIPVIQTVFSPVAQAAQLAGDNAFRAMLADEPDRVHPALEALTSRTLETLQQIKETGADGAFYAIQQMRRTHFSAPVYRALYEAYDLPCIAALADFPINLVHLHGLGVHLPDFPLPDSCWLHWEPIAGNPSIGDVRRHVPNRLAIGLPSTVIRERAGAGNIAEFLTRLRDDAGDRPVILTPGCTLPVDLPAAVVDRWVEATHLGAKMPATALGSGEALLPTVAIREIVSTPLDEVVEKAWDEIVGTAQSVNFSHPDGLAQSYRALRLLLRLEQDLAISLPLDLLSGELDAAALARRIRTLGPSETTAPCKMLPYLFVLAEPDTLAEATVGVARALSGLAVVRVLDCEPALWMTQNRTGIQRLLEAFADQALGEDPTAEIILLGFGAVWRATLALGTVLRERGAVVRFVGLVDPLAPGRGAAWQSLIQSRPPGISSYLKRRARDCWLRWGRLCEWLNMPALLEGAAGLFGQCFGPDAGSLLLSAIKRDRYRCLLTGFPTVLYPGRIWHFARAKNLATPNHAKHILPGDVTVALLGDRSDPFHPPELAVSAQSLAEAIAATCGTTR